MGHVVNKCALLNASTKRRILRMTYNRKCNSKFALVNVRRYNRGRRLQREKNPSQSVLAPIN